jgi:hypothetical protein
VRLLEIRQHTLIMTPDCFHRAVALLATSVVGVLAAAPALAASSPKRLACSAAGATQALAGAAGTLRNGLSWEDGLDLRQEVRSTRTYCGDLTGDGRDEMVIRLVYPGRHAIAMWLTFTPTETGWSRLRFRDPLEQHPYVVRQDFGVGTRHDIHLYEFIPSALRLRISHGVVRETVRTYHRHDSQLKPRGPWVSRSWAWNGSQLVQTAGPLLSPYV